MATQSNLLYVGTKGTVLALDRETGQTRWETSLKGSDFVELVLNNGELFAGSKGRLYRLDPNTGAVQWCNELPGLGWNIVSIAGASAAGAAEQKRREAAAAAAAAAR